MISSFITITNPEERGDRFDLCYESAKMFSDEVVVIDGKDTWPKEFSWELIGQHFQKGYEQATGDWVFHLDADFILHEQDVDLIRQACEQNPEVPALSFRKYQFIRPDRYNIKSRLIIAVNKKAYGNRIKFDGGGESDLCQPSLDGKLITPDMVPESGVPFFNYEKTWKTEVQVRDDVERMARAWERYFGNTHLGTTESAYPEWLKMVIGRASKPSERVSLSFHPRIVQDSLKGLREDQFGYSGFGNFEANDYV